MLWRTHERDDPAEPIRGFCPINAAHGQRPSDRLLMGGSLRPTAPIRIDARVQGVTDGQAILIIDGKDSGQSATIDGAHRSVRFTIDAAAVRRWMSVNIVGAGHPLLIGNPIYIDGG